MTENLLRANEENNKRYNLRARPLSFVVGEKVWVKCHPKSDASEFMASKLCPKFEEGQVQRVIGQNVYWIQGKGGRSRKVHANDLLKQSS